MENPEIAVLDAAAAQAAIHELADVLADCVEGGASVRFMLPFSRDDAAKYFSANAPRCESEPDWSRFPGKEVR